jgi:transposase
MRIQRSGGYVLRSKTVGALPIVNRFLERMRFQKVLDKYLPLDDGRIKLPPSRGIALLLRNLMIARKPLYALGEWAEPFDPAVLGLERKHMKLLNDDRVGRCLDRLFDADRPALILSMVVSAVREFKVGLNQLHNDSTTVSFFGKYLDADGSRVRGKPTPRITFGHSKKRRPDLKQLLYELTVSNDGGIPLHYQVHDGNVTDDQTHRQTWDVLRELAGHPQFLYVADSKLCTEANMRHIAERGGRFVTVLPQTRSEDAWFRDWIQSHPVPWKNVWTRPNTRGLTKPDSVYRGYESPHCSAEGFRILWFHSSEKQRQDRVTREDKLDRARRELEALQERLLSKRTRLRKREKVDKAVASILSSTGTRQWIDVEVVTAAESNFRQSRPGRPSPKTAYRREVRRRFGIQWSQRVDAVTYSANTDGVFPLITNDRALSLRRVLRIYKRQPRVEKRHEQLKSVHQVESQYLKGAARIEALLCVFFLALLVDALIERELRRNMMRRRIRTLPLYPEKRKCRFPTTDRLLELFDGVQCHTVKKPGVVDEYFPPNFTPLQSQVLHLLGGKMGDYAVADD